MLIKCLGALLILWASGNIGFYFAGKLQKRVKTLETLQNVLQMLETEIIFCATDLSDALKHIAQVAKGPVGDFLLSIDKHLYLSAKVAWEKALDTNSAAMNLLAADIEIMRPFGTHLGSTDSENQCKSICHLRQKLHIEEKAAREIVQKNGKMCKSLGLLGGLCAIVILL